jgi:hypothetical protein
MGDGFAQYRLGSAFTGVVEPGCETAQKNDNKTLETLNKQADALLHKLGPEYSKLMDGLEQVDPKSSEATEFMTILSELDKRCTN